MTCDRSNAKESIDSKLSILEQVMYQKLLPAQERQQNVSDFSGFDYLRALFCLLVVSWHMHLLEPLATTQFATASINAFNFNFALLAVPVFFQISFFLYYQNRFSKKDYFKKRISKVGKLYFFWLFIASVFGSLFYSFKLHTISLIGGFKSLPALILAGGHPTFFFFFSLFALTAGAELFARAPLKDEQKYIFCQFLLVLSASLVALLPFIQLAVGDKASFLTYFWNPLNFIPYIFSSYIVYCDFKTSQKPDKRLSLNFKALPLVVLWLVASIAEWKILASDHVWFQSILPEYSRISLLLGSTAVLYLALGEWPHPPKLIKSLSAYSLGIYIFHSFLLMLLEEPFAALALPFGKSFLYIAIVALAILLTKVLRKSILLKDVV